MIVGFRCFFIFVANASTGFCWSNCRASMISSSVILITDWIATVNVVREYPACVKKSSSVKKHSNNVETANGCLISDNNKHNDRIANKSSESKSFGKSPLCMSFTSSIIAVCEFTNSSLMSSIVLAISILFNTAIVLLNDELSDGYSNGKIFGLILSTSLKSHAVYFFACNSNLKSLVMVMMVMMVEMVVVEMVELVMIVVRVMVMMVVMVMVVVVMMVTMMMVVVMVWCWWWWWWSWWSWWW